MSVRFHAAIGWLKESFNSVKQSFDLDTVKIFGVIGANISAIIADIAAVIQLAIAAVSLYILCIKALRARREHRDERTRRTRQPQFLVGSRTRKKEDE